MKKKICIIGAGYMAQEYLKVLTSFKNIEIVGIVGKSISNLKKILKIKKIKVFKNIDEMYSKTKAHGVICAVNETSAYDVLYNLSKYRWFILCEKPLGLNYSESKKIKKLKNNKKLFVALNRRYFSSTQILEKLLKKDKSTRIIEINDQEVNKNINKLKSIKKYWMYCNSIHLIDFIYFFGRGKITQIDNQGSIKKNFVFSKIKFSSGDSVYYKALWNRPGPWMITVSTIENYYKLRPLENLKTIKLNRKITHYKKSELDIKYKAGLHELIKNFIKKLENKKNNLINFTYSHKLMKLINNIYNV